MTPHDYAYVVQLLRDKSSILLEAGKEYLVESRLTPVARRHGLTSASEFIAKLRLDPSLANINELIEAMVTTETFFFRDVLPFETLRTTVLPTLIRNRSASRRLTIWCAASSSGQEPYTIALIIREYFPELLGWNLRIVATDISQEMLRRCREAKYSQLEVNRGLPAALLMKYFRQVGTHWFLDDNVRNMVEFQQVNLSGFWPVTAPIDLIFLRNVMIYFDVATKKSILTKMARLLPVDGYLILGGAETTFNLCDDFERVEGLKSGYYRLRKQ